MSNFSGMGGHQSSRSKTDEWLTPRWLLEAVGSGASFDLDPCAPDWQPFPTAQRVYTKCKNGLTAPWEGRLWLNPPYSRPWLGRFMARMVGHNNGLALIFARTETEIFRKSVWEAASGALFLYGRINFLKPDGTEGENAGAPSVLVSYGDFDRDVLAGCGLDGKFIPLVIHRLSLVENCVTWRHAVASYMRRCEGPVRLDDLYRAFATHPKSRSNPHWQEKIRQTLQKGPFTNVGRGLWAPVEKSEKALA